MEQINEKLSIRLAATKELYETIQNGTRASVNEIAKKYGLTNHYFDALKRAGIISHVGSLGYGTWAWNVEIRPNIHMVQRAHADEKEYQNEKFRNYIKTHKEKKYIDEKRCPECGKIKKITEFHSDVTRSDAHRSVCRSCQNKKDQERRKNKRIYNDNIHDECKKIEKTFVPIQTERNQTKKYGIIRRFFRWLWVITILINI